MSILLGARSQMNSYTRYVVGLYLYATGSQCQVFSVLSHLGLSTSYTTLAGSGTELNDIHNVEQLVDEDQSPMDEPQSAEMEPEDVEELSSSGEEDDAGLPVCA